MNDFIPEKPTAGVLLGGLLLERLLQVHRVLGRQVDLAQSVLVHHEVTFAFVLEQSLVVRLVVGCVLVVGRLTVAGQVVTCRAGLHSTDGQIVFALARLGEARKRTRRFILIAGDS